MAAPEFKLVQQQSGKTLEQMLANYLENGWSVFGLPFEVQNLPTVMVDFGYGNDFNMPPEPTETREES